MRINSPYITIDQIWDAFVDKSFELGYRHWRNNPTLEKIHFGGLEYLESLNQGELTKLYSEIITIKV